MRSKTILSIAVFVFAFAFSTALANLFIPIPQIAPVTYVVTVKSESNVVDRNSRPTSCFANRKKLISVESISALFQQDEINSLTNRSEFSGFDDSSSGEVSEYAAGVEKYVDASSSINTQNLPRDFQRAWREHLKAWRDYSDFLNRTKKSSVRNAVSSEELKRIDDFHSDEIGRTWDEVLQIAAEYDAELP